MLRAGCSARISPLLWIGTTKEAAQALHYFFLCWRQPETLFLKEFIVQKPSEKLGDEREREKERASWVGIYLQGWKKPWEKGCTNRVVRHSTWEAAQWVGRYLLGFSAQVLMSLERTLEFLNIRCVSERLSRKVCYVSRSLLVRNAGICH